MSKEKRGKWFVCSVISGRTLEQAKEMHRGKNSKSYSEAVGKVYVSPMLLNELGLIEGEKVVLKNSFGRAEARAYMDPGLPHFVVFMPMGPIANLLVAYETEGTGMPSFKGVQVELPTVHVDKGKSRRLHILWMPV